MEKDLKLKRKDYFNKNIVTLFHGSIVKKTTMRQSNNETIKNYETKLSLK